MKTCSVCREELPLSSFYRQKAGRFGVGSWCKPCGRTYGRTAYKRDYVPKPRQVREVPPGQAWCPRCQSCRDVAEFLPNRAKPGGRSTYCKPCAKEYANALYARTRAQSLSRYGITKADWDDMYSRQDGRCAICQTVPEKTLHVDHDHKTGRVRGLLCEACNFGLGQYRDNPELLRAAATYLESV